MLSDFRSGDAHSKADIGLLESRGIIGSITSDTNDIAELA
jgi:hypothetical protein